MRIDLWHQRSGWLLSGEVAVGKGLRSHRNVARCYSTSLSNLSHIGILDHVRMVSMAPSDFGSVLCRGDVVDAAASKAEDFVIATGKTVSLRYFVERAFATCGLNWEQYVVADPGLLRPSDIRIE